MTKRLHEEAEKPAATCLSKQPDGIFVDLAQAAIGFDKCVDTVFKRGMRFSGLDYALFSALLYDYDSVAGDGAVKIKLADDVVAFSPKRRELYRAVKVDAHAQRAEYFFEPVVAEVIVEEPVYGEPGEDGVQPIVSTTRREELRPTKLDMDEFIADMWLKGVRFGLNVEVISDVIAQGATMRMDVAVHLDATEGVDAEIEEACNVLRRDNSPKLLLNGKADLRRFQNRFPQIEKGARLLKKNFRVAGKPGFTVDGQRIEPGIPQDNIDLSAMVGPGTHVEVLDGCEYILASKDGFLSLDIESNNISVTDMIENKAGISIKTTGDLSLAGNDFIEYGEVQEGRVVEGKNMTFHSDVYGDVISQGGFILLEGNLSGGSAKSYGGDVTSNGRVFNSVIEATSGVVTLQYAESCVILAESVVIERAVNCEIAAQDIQLARAEGCGIAGKNIRIAYASTCRSKETMVSMLVPDLSALGAQVEQLGVAIADCDKNLALKEQELAELKAEPEFAKYLTLASSIRQGKIQLNAAQQDGWQKMTARFAKQMGTGSRLSTEKQDLANRAKAFAKEQAHLIEERKKSCEGICCELTEVAGDTLVQSMALTGGVAVLQKCKAGEIKQRLREHDPRHKRIFADDCGNLSWHYESSF